LARVAGGSVESVEKGATERRPSYRLRLRLPREHGSHDPCCARAVLRGAFLARGVLGNPADAYHLELTVKGDQLLLPAAERAGVALRRIKRRGHEVYYLKGAEGISRLLRLMGANRAVMRFEHDRIVRDMRGQANRRANSETANVDKQLRAALHQQAVARRLMADERRFERLPPALQQVAQLRVSHPQASLRELGSMAGVSRAAVGNRLRRLLAAAS
jgi:DNA-binding protein WhiA